MSKSYYERLIDLARETGALVSPEMAEAARGHGVALRGVLVDMRRPAAPSRYEKHPSA